MDSQALGEGKATSETVCNASSCTAAILSVHVRFGSKADMCSAKRHVRFTPNSDIDCVFSGCLLWANSGHSTFTPAAWRGPRALDVFTRELGLLSPANSLACEERLGFSDLRPFSVGILRQFHELDVICRRTRAITNCIRGAGCAPEPTIPVRVCLQRCLEFRERSSRLPHF